jgi:hypothetical protein
MMAICRRGGANDTADNAIVEMLSSGGSNTRGLGLMDGDSSIAAYIGSTQRVATATTLTRAMGWGCIGWTKATGTVAPRIHKYLYGTNVQTHANATTTAANGTAATGGTLRLGSFQTGDGIFLDGDIAVVGIWNRVLSDVEVENLPFSLQAWFASAPSWLVVLDQDAVGQKVRDLTGGGSNETGRTGTAVTAQSVPVFTYGAPINPTFQPAAGGTDLTLTPAVGTVAWTASTPALLLDRVLTPGTPNVAWTGSTPAVLIDKTLTPGTPNVDWTGSTPALLLDRVEVPGVAVVAWTGSTPTLITDGSLTLTPGVAVVAWSGSTPAVVTDLTLAPGTPNVAWTGSTPAVTVDLTLTPGVATVAWSGTTPSVILAGEVTVTPGTAVVDWTGSTPVLTAVPDVVVEPPAVGGGRYEPIGDDEDVTTDEVRNLRLKPGAAVVAWTGSRPSVRVEVAPPRFRLPLRKRPEPPQAAPEPPRVVDRTLAPRAGSVAYAGSRPMLVIESFVPEAAYERALARIAELEQEREEETVILAALSRR